MRTDLLNVIWNTLFSSDSRIKKQKTLCLKCFWESILMVYNEWCSVYTLHLDIFKQDGACLNAHCRCTFKFDSGLFFASFYWNTEKISLQVCITPAFMTILLWGHSHRASMTLSDSSKMKVWERFWTCNRTRTLNTGESTSTPYFTNVKSWAFGTCAYQYVFLNKRAPALSKHKLYGCRCTGMIGMQLSGFDAKFFMVTEACCNWMSGQRFWPTIIAAGAA